LVKDGKLMSKIHEDLVAALSQISNPALDGQANYGKYATLPACLDTARQTLSRHNLAIIQITHIDPDRLVTRIVHSSGEFIEDGGVPLLCENKENPQKMGSAITYARRYGLCAMLGIVGEEDDDGQRATPVAERPPAKTTSKPLPLAAVAKVKPPPIVADEIPFTEEDERTDWVAWVEEQIAGFAKHRTTAEHTQWSSTVKDHRQRCKVENLAHHERLLNAYTKRKNELENRSN
jgi:hypothetical protein